MDHLTIPVSEVFGPVWQGEGPHTGRRCWFLRLGHCNLSCSWCDTPYTWDESRFPLEFGDLNVGQITDRLRDAQVVIISGGEPLLHQGRQAMADLVRLPREWHVETNGTIVPAGSMVSHVTHWSVSPKINTNDPLAKRIKPRALEAFAELAHADRAIFKFVVTNVPDVDTAAQLVDRFKLPADAVWIMPEGVTADAVLSGARLVADRVASYGYNLSLRQQVLMYGTERSR